MTGNNENIKFSNFEIIRSLGNQRKRKFGNVQLVQFPGEEKMVLKTYQRSEVKPAILSLLSQEKNFDFKSRHIPPIRYWKEDEQQIQVFYDYHEGQNLDLYLKQIPLKKRAAFLLIFLPKFLKILDAIHQNDIIHCDIKPGNILIRPTKDNFEVSLIDFALAHNLRNPLPRPVLYTFSYSAPELMLNYHNLLSEKSDHFSVGVLIYKILSDKTPLLHPNPAAGTTLQLCHPLPETDNIRNRELALLNKLCLKPAFRLPPIKLDKAELDLSLSESLKSRMPINEFYEDFERELLKRETSVFSRLKNIFSKA